MKSDNKDLLDEFLIKKGYKFYPSSKEEHDSNLRILFSTKKEDFKSWIRLKRLEKIIK